MDIRSMLRPILAILIGVGLLLLVLILIFRAFSGGKEATTPNIDVSTYANTASVATVLIDDPTQLDEEHRQVRITVSGTQNQFEIIKGYQGTVIDSRTYSNNTAAYGVFLESLKLMNYSSGDSNPALKDYRGYCPTGERYIFSFSDGNKDLFSYWSTSCGDQGTFQGNKPAVLNLFEDQLNQKEFDHLTSSISLGF